MINAINGKKCFLAQVSKSFLLLFLSVMFLGGLIGLPMPIYLAKYGFEQHYCFEWAGSLFAWILCCKLFDSCFNEIISIPIL